MWTRRAFLATLPLLAAESRFAGVTIGVQTYSFRDRPFDEAVKAMKEIGIGEAEVSAVHFEPPRVPGDGRQNEKLEQWRLTVPLTDFEGHGHKLRTAGIKPSAYTYNFMGGSDAVLERGFEIAKAMGAPAMTMSTRVSLTPQIDALAKKHKMRVGIHNHSRVQPDQLATPDSFAEALKGRSDYIMMNLDVGHFVAAGFDLLAFVRENHARIMSMHLKDRKKDQGPPVELGTGDTPVVELLRLVRDKKWKIPGYIEHEYKAEDSVAEVRKAFEYCKRALQT